MGLEESISHGPVSENEESNQSVALCDIFEYGGVQDPRQLEKNISSNIDGVFEVKWYCYFLSL